MKKFLTILSNKKIQVVFLIIISLSAGTYFIYKSKYDSMPQSAIFFLNNIELPSKGQKVLLFTPHQDDETLGAGGYIQEAAKRGAQIEIVLVTDGNKHGLKDKRNEEFKKTTDLLGVDNKNLVFLNYSDSHLQEQNQVALYNQFKSIIDNYQPNFIISVDPDDTHPDHATVGKTIQEIMKSESHDIVDYQYLIHANYFPKPKKLAPDDYLLPPVSQVKFDQEWQRFMLTPEEENTKAEAIKTYKTQLENPFLKSLLLSFIRKNEIFAVVKGSQ